jgi:hypothetical protein
MAQVFVTHQTAESWHLTLASPNHLPQLLVSDLGVKLGTREVSGRLQEAHPLHASPVGAVAAGAGALKDAPTSPERRLISRLAPEPQETSADQEPQRTSDGASPH